MTITHIPEDLRWLAMTVKEWGGTETWDRIGKDKDGYFYTFVKPGTYTEKDLLNAKLALGVHSFIAMEEQKEYANIEPTPEEDRAFQEKWPESLTDSKEEAELLEDMVNHPPHYQLRPGYEVYDLRQDLAQKAEQAGIPYDQYSDWDRALEYQLRCWQKNGVEDLRKAKWYLEQLIWKLEN